MPIESTPIDVSPIREPEDFGPIDQTGTGTPAGGLNFPRKRGRPLGSKNKSTIARGLSSKSLEPQIKAFLLMVSSPLMLIPALQRDALDNAEVNALAKSIDQQCQSSPRFRKYIESMLVVGTSTSLFAVVGIIAGRRLVRHNLIPVPDELGGAANIDAALGAALSVMSGGGVVSPLVAVPTPEPV